MDWRRWVILLSAIVNMCIILGGLNFCYKHGGEDFDKIKNIIKQKNTYKKQKENKATDSAKEEKVFRKSYSKPPKYSFQTDSKKDLAKFKQHMDKFSEVIE